MSFEASSNGEKASTVTNIKSALALFSKFLVYAGNQDNDFLKSLPPLLGDLTDEQLCDRRLYASFVKYMETVASYSGQQKSYELGTIVEYNRSFINSAQRQIRERCEAAGAGVFESHGIAEGAGCSS